jgi:hypothetical protein
MTEPIEELYFKWLYSKVASVDVPTPSLTYWTLLRDLHSIEFVWLVNGDDNRAQDGLDLRQQFLQQSFMINDPLWMNHGCSVLEMFIAFSRRTEFQTDIDARHWFWIFMQNLRMDDLNDAAAEEYNISEVVAEVLDQFLWRTYREDGYGGLFPLNEPMHDQRTVELWYQFNEWLEEQEQL